MSDHSNPATATVGIMPHGSRLVDRQLRDDARIATLERAEGLLQIPLSTVSALDLELIAIGAYSPLTGFMGLSDYKQVVEKMRLANGLVWSIPITLSIEDDLARNIKEGQEIALVQGDRLLAIMEVAQKFRYDKEREATRVYQTTETKHPGVARLYRQGDTLLGGDIWLLKWPEPREFPELRHTPAQTRRIFARRGWRRIVGFHTRNPIHRAHEYVQMCALEITDGLFLHPLVGETKPDDIPAAVRIESYHAILRDYYMAERMLLGVFPAAMRYAGPREAILHALCRKNYGCTHFIVGRDHAGVGNYYDPKDACEIFAQFSPEEIGIEPLLYSTTFYCSKCGGIVTPRTCPHEQDRYSLSGTQIREMLRRGEAPPEEIMRPEVSQMLLKAMLDENKRTKPTG